MSESPQTVHGRLLEAVHISGYSFERACAELEWLLEEDRWKQLGYADGAAFGESIFGILSDFRASVEQRKPLAKKLTRIMSHRAVAKVLGVGPATVSRDLQPSDPNGSLTEARAAENSGSEEPGDPNGSPTPAVDAYLSGSQVAKLARKAEERQQKAKDWHPPASAIVGDNPDIADDLGALAKTGHRFGAIYADPPWTFEVYSGAGKQRSAERHYPTMTLEEICAVPVATVAAEDCALFMWAVMPQLPEAFRVLEAWGFEYKTAAFTWVKTYPNSEKPFVGMGYWTRANAEVCLLATRGTPKRLAADVQQVIISAKAEHSKKPEEVARRIVRLVGGPYLEMFSRTQREGWTVSGFGVPTAEAAE